MEVSLENLYKEKEKNKIKEGWEGDEGRELINVELSEEKQYYPAG